MLAAKKRKNYIPLIQMSNNILKSRKIYCCWTFDNDDDGENKCQKKWQTNETKFLWTDNLNTKGKQTAPVSFLQWLFLFLLSKNQQIQKKSDEPNKNNNDKHNKRTHTHHHHHSCACMSFGGFFFLYVCMVRSKYHLYLSTHNLQFSSSS